MIKAAKLLFGMARRLVKVRRHANEMGVKLEAVDLELAESKSKCDYLRKEITMLESKNNGLNSEIEILRMQVDSLALVIKRDQERVAAETAMYMLAAQGEPVKHVGAKVASYMTPGMNS
jgi:chromosome segregation ATPase